MGCYRSRTYEVDAVRWSGSNWHQVLAMAGRENVYVLSGGLFVRGEGEGHEDVPVNPEDWVVNNDGRVFKLTHDVFKDSYEECAWPGEEEA